MPSLLGVRAGTLLRFYGWRLRRHCVQELLAASGIAVGVALVFGVLVANTSLTGSANQLVHGLVGAARLQLAARSADGLDQRLVQRVRNLPGVKNAAPVLQANVALVGPGGRQSIELLGVSPALVAFGGVQMRSFGPGGLRLSSGIALPSTLADAIGAQPDSPVTLLAQGDAQRILVGAVLSSSAVGSLAGNPVAIALLPVAQKLAELPGRVSQVLVEPRAGQDRAVARELRGLAAGRLDVVPADNELRLLRATAKPNDQSTTLFAAIGAMVGFLLALNAMLLTVPERRRFVAELRMQGFEPRQILVVLGFEALVLGVLASLVGVILGEVLSRSLFHQVPAYLAFAFPIGTRQVVHTETIVLALAGGVLATLLAALPPAFDLRRKRAADAVFRETGEAGEKVSARVALTFGAGGVFLVGFVTLLVLIMPSLTIVGGVTLALATLCLIPATFATAARCLGRLSRNVGGSMLVVAVMELRATTTRSIALAGVAALAVYGSVAIQGAHQDLLRGLDANFADFLNTADIWVTTGGNDLTTNSFRTGNAVAAVTGAPSVASVRAYQGGLLDVGSRRLWIIARASDDSSMIPASQLQSGDLVRATQLLRLHGWAAISGGFASGRHLRVGGAFTLPTPAGPARFRVAAITTNLGWPPGAVILAASDYRRYWQSTAPAALEVDLKPGVTPAAGKRAVERALGVRPGLRVQTLHEREAQYAVDSRQGLQALSQISTLLLITAALAVAFALSAAIWQRRARLASLKIQGFDRLQLWRSLLLESAVVLAIGCAVGAVLGLYGHALASRWLELATGFPAVFAFGGVQVLFTLALLVGIALAVVALPGFLASGVPPRASFQE
jgi:putative ABC transport system permease protein